MSLAYVRLERQNDVPLWIEGFACLAIVDTTAGRWGCISATNFRVMSQGPVGRRR